MLLERLIKTIPQGMSSEIIVIDDNSTQHEKERLNYLSSQYNFKLYDNEGMYAGGARNTGLKYANGKWLLFADADDYFTDEAEALIYKYLDSSEEIIFFNVISKYSDTGEDAYRAEHIRSIIANALQQHSLNILRCCYTAPWGKMIKRDLVEKHHIRFDEVVAGNDMMFSVLTGLRAEKVAFDMTPIYCVTVHFGSITTTLSKDKFESRFQVTLNVNTLLKKEGYGRYQISVLYFIGKSYQFGIKYIIHVIHQCILHRSNPLIGIRKLLTFKSVLRDRQNLQRK